MSEDNFSMTWPKHNLPQSTVEPTNHCATLGSADTVRICYFRKTKLKRVPDITKLSRTKCGDNVVDLSHLFTSRTRVCSHSRFGSFVAESLLTVSSQASFELLLTVANLLCPWSSPLL